MVRHWAVRLISGRDLFAASKTNILRTAFLNGQSEDSLTDEVHFKCSDKRCENYSCIRCLRVFPSGKDSVALREGQER